jgi:hypothetical protein
MAGFIVVMQTVVLDCVEEQEDKKTRLMDRWNRKAKQFIIR